MSLLRDVILLMPLLFLSAWERSLASAISTDTSSSSSYTSVRALDEYGHSEQLQNALKAANLQGTLVMAARNPNRNSTIVISLLETPKGSGKVSRPQNMLHLLNNNAAFVTGSAAPITTALVCTGLKGDANWLIEKVRTYSHRVWERYNTFLDAPGAAYAVSKFTRKFWGYDEESEWQPGLLLADQQGQSQEDRSMHSWGRPLGVATMIVSSSLPYIFVVEPSGVVQRYSAFAMGKRSGEVLEKLSTTRLGEGTTIESKSKDVTTEDNMQEQMIELIQEIVGSSSTGHMNILIEELSETGVNRTMLPLA